MRPGWLFRLRYSPFVAHLVVVRRCNLSCAYCNEWDDHSDPVPTSVLEDRLEHLRRLGVFAVVLTGGEPMLHPDLPWLVRRCRALGFLRTALISNGFLLRPQTIGELNEAGLQELQISIDGIRPTATTQKVLDRLWSRLEWLRDQASFHVTVNGVIGACPPEEAREVIRAARRAGFTPRVLLIHRDRGQFRLSGDETRIVESILGTLPSGRLDLTDYRKKLLRGGLAPFRCRSGSRYLYVDENGRVSWCSQTRSVWSMPLPDYGLQDLREQFYAYKPCNETCTIGCSRATSAFDGWRRQERPGT